MEPTDVQDISELLLKADVDLTAMNELQEKVDEYWRSVGRKAAAKLDKAVLGMMTTEEKIKVMQAYVDGKPIEYYDRVDCDWSDCTKPIWDWYHYAYRIKPEEKKPEYRPYKDTDEMVEDFYKRINSGKASYSMPLIWVKSKDDGDIGLVTDYSKHDACIGVAAGWYSLDNLFHEFTYLDGSPVGKKVE